jgi:hypothetical protein
MVEFGKIHVKIKGLTPLLMNRLNPEDLASSGVKEKQYDPKAEARKAAYITTVDGKEQLYIPSRWLYSMLIKAAGAYKAKGKRASLSGLLAGTVRVEPEEILLGHCNYEIDERPVRIGNAKVLAWRPKIKDWTAEFDIIYNKMHITREIALTLKNILEDGGITLGIGDFRPQHKGPFGTFTVEEFKIVS